MPDIPFWSIFADEVWVWDRKIGGKMLKWSVFHDCDSGSMYAAMQEGVFPFIRNLCSGKGSKYFQYVSNHFAFFTEQTDKSKLAIQQNFDKLEILKKSLMQEYFG